MIRALRILWALARHRLDRLIPPQIALPLWARFLRGCLRLIPVPVNPPAASLRLALEQLGPVFVKLGQILSTRRDLFETSTADELQKLQDQVPPFAIADARRIIEAGTGMTIETAFKTFDDVPLASASVAQVHTATLHDGSEAVVKVIRPGIETVIQADLRLMFQLARAIETILPASRRFHPTDIVRDYEHTILGELDLTLEAANTARLRDNWAGSHMLYVPAVHWDLSSRQVLVMERIYGQTVANLDAIQGVGTDMRQLAHLGVEIFFTQVFDHNFFHADMHPGNVFVDITDPANPTYIALDCAIIGSLTERDKDYLARNLLAFFNRDYAEVASLHVASGWVPAETDLIEFEAIIRSVCEPVFQRPIREISFGKVLLSLFQTARRFDMEVQPQLVLLQKTLLNIEGMGRQIYPDLDLWETAAPFMERWMAKRVGPVNAWRTFSDDLPKWLPLVPQLPALAFAALTRLGELGNYQAEQAAMLRSLTEDMNRQRQRTRYARLGGGAMTIALAGVVSVASLGAGGEILLGSSVLGGIGVYWLYLKP